MAGILSRKILEAEKLKWIFEEADGR